MFNSRPSLVILGSIYQQVMIFALNLLSADISFGYPRILYILKTRMKGIWKCPKQWKIWIPTYSQFWYLQDFVGMLAPWITSSDCIIIKVIFLSSSWHPMQWCLKDNECFSTLILIEALPNCFSFVCFGFATFQTDRVLDHEIVTDIKSVSCTLPVLL